MPELPEVETIKCGLQNTISGLTVSSVDIHQPKLRRPVPDGIRHIRGEKIHTVSRRGKYLLATLQKNIILCHLGMSGSLWLRTKYQRRKHDHVIITFTNGYTLSYNDPRRFGLIDCYRAGSLHPLLAKIGVDPLTDTFSANSLYTLAKTRTAAIKNLLMNSSLIAGIGNIYASEALFRAGIRPARSSATISRKKSAILVDAIKQTLNEAIAAGGTTLQNFVDSQGKTGYFQQQLAVYARAGKPCRRCSARIVAIRLAGRSSFYCPSCQK